MEGPEFETATLGCDPFILNAISHEIASMNLAKVAVVVTCIGAGQATKEFKN